MQKELEKDFNVYMVPELPTLTMQGGGMINIMKMSFEQNLAFQVHFISQISPI